MKYRLGFLSTFAAAVALSFCASLLDAQSTQPNEATSPSTNAQQPDQDKDLQQTDHPFTFKVNVIQRSTQAIDYRDRGGTTQVDFKGTSLIPKIEGRAKVTGHTGRLAIDASFHHLQPARSFGPEYLTYVLWAITPEGRAVNLGEVMPNGDGDVDVQVTSGLQEFGMILTAEPYFAVTRPSDVLVAENIVRPDTAGGIHPITAKYELLQKGQYTVNIPVTELPATNLEHQKKSSLQILEAENAIAIAQASGADQYAPDTLQKAKDYLSQAQEYERRKQGKTPIGTVARAAAQAAEDARLITLEKKQQERVAAERHRSQERIRQAQSEADREAARADEAHLEAQRQSDQRALAEQERQAAELAKSQADQARLAAQQEKLEAQQQLQQAEAARQAALQQQQALSQQAEQARLQAQQAEQARLQSEQQAEQQRQRLLQQLNQVLQTKDTAKGLIVNVSDVLFDTGKATLKPGARVRLARVAGIILAYPDLKLEVDGYTDSTGSLDLNMGLSERRAAAVRNFLVSQGVPSTNVTERGFGPDNPVATNSTAAGRQMNRRVEMVVSGEAIGSNLGGGTNAGSVATPGVSGSVSTPGVSANPGSPATSQQAPISSPSGTTTPAMTTPASGVPGTPSSTPPPMTPGATQTTNPSTRPPQ
ncbi:MAG TPA: OmpA family protein [Candidatus Angelobacter sp.]|nr:OmpA family protein [Candidatus Angelobacter sp.]